MGMDDSVVCLFSVEHSARVFDCTAILFVSRVLYYSGSGRSIEPKSSPNLPVFPTNLRSGLGAKMPLLWYDRRNTRKYRDASNQDRVFSLKVETHFGSNNGTALPWTPRGMAYTLAETKL